MSFDHVIVGAGVCGCATALYLARAGAKVLVLEADEVAAGASGGLGHRGVRGNRRASAELPLMAMAYPIWAELSDDLGHDVGYQRLGGLNLVEQEATGTSGGRVSLAAHAWKQNQLGVPTEVLDADQVRVYEPGVGDDVLGALWCPLDGIADHTATTKAFANAAADAGAVIREQSRVRSLRLSDGRVRAVVMDDDTEIEFSGKLLLLNNTGVSELVAELDEFLPVWDIAPQVLTAAASSGVPRHLIGHDHRTLSIKPHPGGVMVSGGWRGQWDPATRRGQAIPEYVDASWKQMTSVFPPLVDATLTAVDVSRVESCSADGLPIIDTVPPVPNVVIGTGWSGHGFAIAPAVATLLARWLTDHEKPRELLPFRYDRFINP